MNWNNADVKIVVYNAELEDEINGFAYDAATNSTTARNLEETSTRDGLEVAGEYGWDDTV